MQDDLNFLGKYKTALTFWVNGRMFQSDRRRPQFFRQMEDELNFIFNEDDLNFIFNENDLNFQLNERRSQL